MSVLEAQGEADVAAVETGRQPHADMGEELTICVLALVASFCLLYTSPSPRD